MENKIAIIHVVESLDDKYGGPARSVPMISMGLQDLGIINILISVDFDFAKNSVIAKDQRLRWDKVKPSNIAKGYYSAELKWKIKNTVTELRENGFFVIIHLHSIWSFPSVAVFCVCRQIKVPYVISPRSSLQTESLKKNSFIKKIVGFLFINQFICQARFLHVTSDSEYADVRDKFEGLNIFLSENGLDFTEFGLLPTKAEAKESIGVTAEERCILFMSRVNRRKGLDILYESFSKLCENQSNIILLIAGPVDDVHIIDDILFDAKNKGIEASIKYLGMTKGVERLNLFSAADVFVLPTKFENFGMSIAEAFASGLRVITTKMTPWQEAEKLGFCQLVDRDCRSFQVAIEKYLENDISDSTRTDMKNYIVSNYDYRKKAAELVAQYEKLL